VQDELFFTTHLIKVEFELNKNSKPLEAIARMLSVEKPKHLDNYYMRLEFVKIEDEDRKKIIDFVTHKAK
jgi:c-di-GMP-binding flagellar brake protein YcgR